MVDLSHPTACSIDAAFFGFDRQKQGVYHLACSCDSLTKSTCRWQSPAIAGSTGLVIETLQNKAEHGKYVAKCGWKHTSVVYLFFGMW